MPKPITTQAMLAALKPPATDSSEAHAIGDCISDALDDIDGPSNKKAMARAMLIEFRDWSAAMISRLDGSCCPQSH